MVTSCSGVTPFRFEIRELVKGKGIRPVPFLKASEPRISANIM